MRKLIRADISRILRKPTFYILIVLSLIEFAAIPAGQTAALQIEGFKTQINIFPLFFVGIPAFLAIFSDEMKSGRMIDVMGGGLSRKKILLAKLLDFLILLLMYFAVAYGIMLIKNTTAGIGVTPKQNLNLLLYCMFAIIKLFGFFALASLVVFASWSAAGGIIILLIMGTLSSVLLQLIQDNLNLPFFDVSYVGLLESSFASFAAGKFGWQIIPALLIYLGGVIIISIVIFNRKEIEL